MMFKSPAGEAEYMACYDAALGEWQVPYESLRLPTRFGVTHVTACGPEDGPPLVLFHAAGTSSPVWRCNVAAVSQTHRTFLVDTIDEPGKSECTVPFQSRADAATWVGEVLDGLKIERAHLGGISRGSWLALNFALAAPERVRGIMLLPPAASFARFRLAFFFHFLVPIIYPTRGGIHRTFKWLSGTEQIMDERLADLMYLGVKHYRFPKGGVPPTVFSDEELRSLQPPTLMLIGEGEVLSDPHRMLERARRLVPGIEAELLPNAGHLLAMEQAELVNRRMAAFLERTGA